MRSSASGGALRGAGSGSDEERGAPLASTGRSAASALTCGREDGERCHYAEGSVNDPQKKLAVQRLYIAMSLCGTFMLVRSRTRAERRALMLWRGHASATAHRFVRRARLPLTLCARFPLG